jgi:hypothetical protein
MEFTRSKEFVEHVEHVDTPQEPAAGTLREKFCVLLASWEVYPILLVAGLLRLCYIDTTVFTEDEAVLFRMAHDAVAYGLLPVTGNKASIGPLNPPLFTYIMMLPASLSANPLGGEIVVGVLNTAAVLLTYMFVRRYYGRLAGSIAALLYATSVGALVFSRDIWQPNLIPFFELLFWFALFWGVVERRKGWLFPALLLMGVLYQLHGSTLLLGVPLCIAFVFAFKRVRVRDFVFALGALILIFSPFLILELHTGFSEVRALLQAAKNPAHTDLQALHFYKFFLGSILKDPYLDAATRFFDTHIVLANDHSLLVSSPLRYFRRFLDGETALMPLLVLCAGLGIAGVALWPRREVKEGGWVPRGVEEGGWVPRSDKGWLGVGVGPLGSMPYRQGLILLLSWQVVPLMLLLRHSITLFSHYFIFLLPGPFILLAIGGSKAIELARRYRPNVQLLVRVAVCGLASVVIIAQLIGSAAFVIDVAHGNFDGAQVYPYVTDLDSLQHALNEADQLAQQRHIKRIYAPTVYAYSIGRSFPYLSEQLKTPITFVDSRHCLILPDAGSGPVVFLAPPASALTDAFLSQYATASLIDQPRLLGGAPFKLYILTAKAEPVVTRPTFQDSLQLLSANAHPVQSMSTSKQWLTTRWRIMDTQSTQPRTTYQYKFQMQYSVSGKALADSITCMPTATWAGDQLFVFQEYEKGAVLPASITTQVSTSTQEPTRFKFGPLTMTTFNDTDTTWKKLKNGE